MSRYHLMLACLLMAAPALASAPQNTVTQQPVPPPTGAPTPAAVPPSVAERRAKPCQGQSPERTTWPNGTLLWGSTRQKIADETSTVLASLDLRRIKLGGAALKSVSVKEGRLVAPSRAPEDFVNAMLQGAASDGQPVEVAVCDAQPSADDPAMVWYSIEVWNEETASWENPCIATTLVPEPRALAVQGVWDGSGAHRKVAGKFTLACENGAIAKCINWGYKPWAKKDGRSLAPLHQACTRMVRADYCGDGRSHTYDDNPIDIYDSMGLLTRATEASDFWQPELASFEAAWGPDGAMCLSRTRDGQAVDTILAQCPGRFEVGEKDLGEGDRCTMRRKGARATGPLLRNHSYGNSEQASLQN